MSPILTLVAAALVVLFGYVASRLLAFRQKYVRWVEAVEKFPGPKRHWFWGNLKQFPSFKLLLKHMYEEYVVKNNATGRFWLGFFRPAIQLSKPETFKTIMHSSVHIGKARGGAGYDFLVPWIGLGLLVSEGKQWERNRKLLTRAFHFDILQNYLTIYNSVADVFTKILLKETSSGRALEVFYPTSLATLDTMLQCAMSYKGGIQGEREGHPYVKAIERLSHLLLFRAARIYLYPDVIFKRTKEGKEFYQHCESVHNFTNKIIDERKIALASNPDALKKRNLDFLDILLTARDENGDGLTDDEIRNEAGTFMFAGHDTTATVISWAIYALGKYPNEQEKIRAEVDAVMGSREDVEWEDLQRFKYMAKFMKECMRLFTPVPMASRLLHSPCEIEGVVVPEGVVCDMQLYNMHHNPHVWKDPWEFNTNRFDQDSEAEKDPFMFVPFSAGPRNCIGQNFAQNEIKVFLAKIIRRCRVTLDDDPNHQAVPEPASVVLRSSTGLWVKMEAL